LVRKRDIIVRVLRLLFIAVLITTFVLDYIGFHQKITSMMLFVEITIEAFIYLIAATTYSSLSQYEKITAYYNRTVSNDGVFDTVMIASIIVSSYYVFNLSHILIISPIIFIGCYITYSLVQRFDKSIDDVKELELPLVETMIRTWSVGKNMDN